MKLIGIVQVYNEVDNGNLGRCLESLSQYCDAIQIYDDASMDNPGELYEKYSCDVIWGSSNDFKNELEHKQQQLDRCKELGADWIFRIDCDEIIEYVGEKTIRELLRSNHDSWAFHTINLWRHPAFYRVDSSYNDVVFNRLWKVPPEGLKFDVKPGLHQTNYPIGATENEGFSGLKVLHYGFASNQAILDKYHMYKRNGQAGWQLNRLIDESSLRVRSSKVSWFKNGLSAAEKSEIFRVPIKDMI